MDYTIKSIPTEYQGVVYRSRLECRWAIMFNMLGWKFEYEPPELPGWIPDFKLYGENEPIFVNVKPFSSLQQFDDSGEIARSISAIAKSGNVGADLLLLGETIFSAYHASIIGWIGTYFESEGLKSRYEFGDAILMQASAPHGLLNSHGNLKDRILAREYENPRAFVFAAHEQGLKPNWNQAGNITQWLPPAT